MLALVHGYHKQKENPFDQTQRQLHHKSYVLRNPHRPPAVFQDKPENTFSFQMRPERVVQQSPLQQLLYFFQVLSPNVQNIQPCNFQA